MTFDKRKYQIFMKNDHQKVPKIFFGNNMLKSIAKTPSDIPNTSLSSELKIPKKINKIQLMNKKSLNTYEIHPKSEQNIEKS